VRVKQLRMETPRQEGVTPISHAVSCKWVPAGCAAVSAQDSPSSNLCGLRVSRRAAAAALLRMGADVDLPAADGQTALIGTVHWENDEALRQLLEHGVDTTRRDQHGRTALDVSLRLMIGKPCGARGTDRLLREEEVRQRSLAPVRPTLASIHTLARCWEPSSCSPRSSCLGFHTQLCGGSGTLEQQRCAE
jgi:hypothetical protein